MMRSSNTHFGIFNFSYPSHKRELKILDRITGINLFRSLTSFLLFTCSTVFAQLMPSDSLAKKVAIFHKVNPNDVLYVATDKDVYLPTETIWFAGYVVEAFAKSDTSLRPSILSVALLRDDTTSVSIRKNYLVSNFTSSGSLTLPENIAPGSYLLLATTNIVDGNGKPVHIFRRAVTIRSATISSINVDFEISEKPGVDSVFVKAKTIFPIGISATDRRTGELSYQFGDERTRKVKYGLDGNAFIPLAKAEIRQHGNVLSTITKIGKTTKRFNVKLPIEQSTGLELGFYPEGGDLVSGLESRVAWQSVTKEGTPQQTRVLLKENGKVIDTISTDQFGMGTFKLNPKAVAIYEASTLSEDYTQLFKLPAVQQRGYVLHIANAVVNDTLIVEIAASNSEEVSIAITNEYSKESELTPSFALGAHRKKLKLPLATIKKGLNTFTLLDSQGRPVAERLFFAHVDGGSKANIVTDKESYASREKVSVGISLADVENRAVSGLFTVSCVQESRLDSTAKQDLAGYYYMKPIVAEGKFSLLNSSKGMSKNRGYLEKVLLIRGWRRYLWRDIQQAADSPAKFSKKALSARFSFADGSKINGSLLVTIKNGITANTVALDENGSLVPKAEDITLPEDKSLDVLATTKDGKLANAILKVDNPMEKMIAYLASLRRYPPLKDIRIQQTTDLRLKTSFTEINLLKEVVIGQSSSNRSKVYGPNDCGDFVCGSHYLNCAVHSAYDSGSYKPKKGETYNYMYPASGGYNAGKVLYKGCTWEFDELTLYTAKQFYGMDASKLEKVDEKEYLSTLYWKDFAVMPNTGSTSFNFYTGDLLGSFKIRVEGFDANGELYYQEKVIKVEK